MATSWGICSAGKISHDFTVALNTLPDEDHRVRGPPGTSMRRTLHQDLYGAGFKRVSDVYPTSLRSRDIRKGSRFAASTFNDNTVTSSNTWSHWWQLFLWFKLYLYLHLYSLSLFLYFFPSIILLRGKSDDKKSLVEKVWI